MLKLLLLNWKNLRSKQIPLQTDDAVKHLKNLIVWDANFLNV